MESYAVRALYCQLMYQNLIDLDATIAGYSQENAAGALAWLLGDQFLCLTEMLNMDASSLRWYYWNVFMGEVSIKEETSLAKVALAAQDRTTLTTKGLNMRRKK